MCTCKSSSCFESNLIIKVVGFKNILTTIMISTYMLPVRWCLFSSFTRERNGIRRLGDFY